jgi:hypothetical protein
MEGGIDYSTIEKKNHYAVLKWRRQIGFEKKKTVRSFARAVLVKDAVQIHLRLTPAVRVVLEGRGCAPVNADGFRGTRMEARRGLVTATGQEGIAEDMLRAGLKRGA